MFDLLDVPQDLLPELLPQTVISHFEGRTRTEDGVFSFIARSEGLQEFLEDKYGRKNLCLKIFKKKDFNANKTPEVWTWGPGGVDLKMASMVTNVFARHDLAPRVYDLVTLPGKRAAQVTDYIAPRFYGITPEMRIAAREIAEWQGVKWITHDMNPHNFLNGQYFVDWQYSLLPADYEERLKERAYKVAAWGSRPEPYQSALGSPSQRDHAKRIAPLNLDEIDFRGKSVLDVGCNLGDMCREAARRGAKKIVGVDLPAVADLAADIANWLGYWNIDFVRAHLPRERGKIATKYDIIFCLSCNQAKPFPWIYERVGEVIFVEGHVPQKDHDYRDEMEEYFCNVSCLGSSRDHGPRVIMKGEKNG